MPTKITFVINNPADPTAFESAYKSIADNARQFPKLVRSEAAKVWPKENGSPTPAYRTLDLYFNSYEEASEAVKAPAARELFDQLGATGTPFIALFSDIENS